MLISDSELLIAIERLEVRYREASNSRALRSVHPEVPPADVGGRSQVREKAKVELGAGRVAVLRVQAFDVVLIDRRHAVAEARELLGSKSPELPFRRPVKPQKRSNRVERNVA